MTTILLTGPTGFVGSHLLPALIDAGHVVRALIRNEVSRDTVLGRLSATQRPRVAFVTGDVTQPDTLAGIADGADAAVHLVAIPRDRTGGHDLERVNYQGTVDLLAGLRRSNVERVVHLGAMGVVDDPSLHYARSKARAEAAVRGSGLLATILRPSLLWGERDGFFNIVATLVRASPGLVPIPAHQRARFQPLWVGDLARVVVQVIARDDSVGATYELGGPDHWTYRQMVAEVIDAMGAHRAIVPLPLPLIKVVARTAEALHLPFPVASDQLRQLAFDNAAELDGVERAFGFSPRAMKGGLGYLRQRLQEQEPQPDPT